MTKDQSAKGRLVFENVFGNDEIRKQSNFRKQAKAGIVLNNHVNLANIRNQVDDAIWE